MFGHNPIASNPFSSAGISQLVFLTGVSGTGQLGSASVTADANVDAVGVSSTGQVGSVTITGTSNVFPIGVQGTGQVGQVLIWSVINDSQTPNWEIIRTAA